MVDGDRLALLLSGLIPSGFGQSIDHSGKAIGEFEEELRGRVGEQGSKSAGELQAMSDVGLGMRKREGSEFHVESDALTQGFMDLEPKGVVEETVGSGEDEGAVVSGVGAVMSQKSKDVEGLGFEAFDFVDEDDRVDGLEVV
jgi:hypothetical protein